MNKNDKNFLRSFHKELPCKMSEAERSSLSERIVDAHEEFDRTKQHAKEIIADKKREIAAAEKKRNLLLYANRDGVELRMVECYQVANGGAKVTYRSDTNEQVGDAEPLGPDEQQMSMPHAKGPGASILKLVSKPAEQKPGLSIAEQKAMGVAETNDGDVVPPDEPAPKKPRGKKKG